MRIQPEDTSVLTDAPTIRLQPAQLPAAEAGTAAARAIITPAPGQAEEQGGSFADLLGEALRAVNSLQQASDLAAERVATGDAEDLHEAIIAMEKADLALRLTAQVTQRAIEAYKEIAHTQL